MTELFQEIFKAPLKIWLRVHIPVHYKLVALVKREFFKISRTTF